MNVVRIGLSLWLSMWAAYADATPPNCDSFLQPLDRNDHAPRLKDIVDIHGIEGTRAQRVLQKYTPYIQTLETRIMTEFLDMNQGHAHPKLMDCLITQKKQWLSKVQHQEGFGFIDLQTVYYPQNDTIYTTLEVIESDHDPRMHFLPQTEKTPLLAALQTIGARFWHQRYPKKDIIVKMQQYDALALHLLLTHQLDEETAECPFYHCLSSFQHPQLHPYLTLFQRHGERDRLFIINTLYHDPDAARRAAAAFLVGHFNDPDDIIRILSPCVTDSASSVRNNALRVIATTLSKTPMKNVDCRPFIDLLSSPFVTDRNKALTILTMLSDQPQCQSRMIQQGQLLMALLHGRQPNNHDEVYRLLQQISHRHFGAQEFGQWQNWFTRSA